MSYGEDYGIGSYGSPYNADVGACAEKCICSALDVGLSSITAALLEIDHTLQYNYDKNCEIVDKCKDEIISLIDKHYKTQTKSCDECRADLHAGLGGTLEYAVACAGACIDEVKQTSQCDSLSQEGDSCDTCGCKPCKCTGLECVSVDPDSCKETTKAFTGWCNPATGSVVVRETRLGSPGEDYTQGYSAETEQVAFEETALQCGYPLPAIPQSKTIPLTFADSANCQIDAYISGTAIEGILKGAPNLNIVSAEAEVRKEILKLGFEGLNVGTVANVIYGVYRSESAAPSFFASYATPYVAAACGVKDQRWGELVELLANISVVGKETGLDFTPYTDSIRYAANSISRMQFLNPGQAMDAYLAGAMSDSQLDAHWAIGNICNTSLNQAIQAAETKPSPGQLIAMRDRGLIDNKALHDGFRRLGYLNDSVVSKIDALSEKIPDVSDILRIAQKDALNDGAASHFQLDTGFAELNRGKTDKWLAANAIKDDTAKTLWRAHWSDPSVSDLFMFWHRLRHDPSFGGESRLRQDIKDTLFKLGVSPYWQQHYVATSLNPLPIRAIKGAYTSGSLTESELKRALEVTGADDNAVKVLSNEYKKARRQDILSSLAIKHWTEQVHNATVCKAELALAGYDAETITRALDDAEYQFERSTWAESYVKGMMTADNLSNKLTGWGVSNEGANAIIEKLSYKIVDHAAQKSYIAGTITREQAADRMSNDGMPQETIYRLLRDADDGITNSLAMDCTRGIKHRYLMGEITNDEAKQFLTGRNIVSDRVGQLVSNFDCERAAQGRSIAVEKLCHWLYIGAISQPDFMDRLLRLGYSEANAALLLHDCVQSNTLRAIKEADKIQRELQSSIDKQQRAIAKVQATAQRNAERLATARKKKQQLRANRDHQLLSASEKLYKNTEGELSGAIQAVKDALYTCETRYGLGIDECLKIAILASEQMKGHARADFGELVNQLAEAAASDGLDPTDSELGILPSSNGSTQPSG